MTGESIEGRIEILLEVTETGSVADARVENHRPTAASRMLEGRPVGTVVPLLPFIFSLCGRAQAIAGLAAGEAAVGLELPEPQHQARRFLLLAETALEHASTILRDWAPLAGAPPDLETLRLLRTVLAGLEHNLYADGKWVQLGGGTVVPDATALANRVGEAAAIVREAIFGGDWRPALADFAAFRAWADGGRSPAARLVAYIHSAGLGGFAGSGVMLMGPLDHDRLDRLLAEDTDGAFVAAPHWEGQTLETGPLARQRREPLVAQLLAESGPGLAARFAARLCELGNVLTEMQAMTRRLAPSSPVKTAPRAAGSGLATVEAARGRLAHRVVIAGGIVRRYQIVAPTEWNLHDGALKALRGETLARAKHLAPLLVAALDPCVAWSLVVKHLTDA